MKGYHKKQSVNLMITDCFLFSQSIGKHQIELVVPHYELMLVAKNQFNLEEIKDKSFEKITNSFKGGGSNKPIATVIWYINLLKLRKEFNPSEDLKNEMRQCGHN